MMGEERKAKQVLKGKWKTDLEIAGPRLLGRTELKSWDRNMEEI